jgi:Na+/proline symporter
MQPNFHVIDYTIVMAYFAALLGLGFYLRKRASSSLEDYFLGGRRLPWWALGFSGMASNVNITGTMIILAFIYMLGPRGTYIEFRGGACLVLGIFMLWAGKWHRRSGCITGAEWMIFRFGTGAGAQFARLVSALATIVGIIGLLALTIKGLGIFLAMFLPFSPFVCSLIFIGIATFYTVISGFYGVVFTDIFQSILVIIGAVGVSLLAASKIIDYQSFADIAYEVTANKDWMSSLPSWKTTLLPGFEGYQYLLTFAAFYFIQNLFLGFSGGADPKFFGARSDRECGQLGCLWIVIMTFRWPLMMAFAVFGIFLVKESFPDQTALFQACELIKQYVGNVPESRWGDVVANIVNNPGDYSPQLIQGLGDILKQGWEDKIYMLSYHGNINPETIMPAVLLFSIPAGFRGILLIALIAAAMSTFDSEVNRSAGYFAKDLYQGYIRPKAKTRELIWASYGFILFIVAAGFGLAYTLKSINDIWGWIVMGLGAGLVIPSFLRLYWWRFNGGGFAIGTFVGLTSAIVTRIFWPGMDERVQFVTILSFTLICTVVATVVFEPTAPEVLGNFYDKTRPFGFWGPLKKKLPVEVRTKMEKEHFYDILSVPFVMGWQVSMFMMPMQLIIRSYKAFWVTLYVFFFCLGGMYLFWYKKLPPKTEA